MNTVKDSGAEKHYFRKRAVRITAIALTCALCVLFSVAFAIDFDVKSGLFENGSVIAGFAYYGSFAAFVAVIMLTFIVIPKEKKDESVFPSESEYFRYYTVDGQFIKIFRISLTVLIAVQGVVRAVSDGMDGKGYFTLIGMLLLSIAMALYFVPELTERIADLGGRLHLVFGVFGMLWLLLNTFIAYFNRALPLSSEYVVLTEVGYLLTLLAITYEIRFRLDGTGIRARLATACATFVFGTGFGVGRIVMLIANGQVSYSDTALAITMLAISLYFGVRVFFYSED